MEKMGATPKLVEEKTDGVKARTVLWYMTFFGFAVNYIIRINANIAIVDMIDLNYKKNVNENKTIIVASECFLNDITNSSDSDDKSLATVENDRSKRYTSIERRLLDYFEIEYERDGFKWDEHKQGMFLGSFYWLHWASQIPGGILATKYGTKFVFGYANYISCVLCFITPLISYLDYRVLVFVRLVSGIFTGCAWPAMHHLVGLWIPGNERSRFVTAYLGSSIGTAIAYPIFGYIIKISSWEWVFHACFVVGTIWFILWQYTVYDSPEEHPRIHPSEKGYILQVLGSSVIRDKDQKKEREIPWIAILSSRSTWMACVAQIGGIWGLFTLLTQSPTYFRIIHGWSIEMVGVLSGIPHLLRTGFSFLFSMFGDYLLTQNKMSRERVRKFATLFHLVLNGVCCLGLAYSGCNIVMAVSFLSVSLALHGAVSSGVLAGMIDNSPNYSGIILGITSTIAICSGFVSPMIVGYLTFENQTTLAWQHIFELTAIIMIISGIIYILFNDGTIQPWNKPKSNKVDAPEISLDLRKQLLSLSYESARRASIDQNLDESKCEIEKEKE